MLVLCAMSSNKASEGVRYSVTGIRPRILDCLVDVTVVGLGFWMLKWACNLHRKLNESRGNSAVMCM